MAPLGACYHAHMTWWIWVLLGLGLLAFEVATPGALFTLFFGVGALCVAVFSALGMGAVYQWLSFAVISLALVGLLRGRLQEKLRSPDAGPIDSLIGAEVVLLADLPEGGETKAELRGSPWNARAASGIPLGKGQRCKVERVDGVVLYVTAI